MEYILHQNTWKWGRAETIVLADGFGLCRVSVEDKDKSMAWLTNLIVFDDKRRQGLGNRLLDIAIKRAAKMGAKTLCLWVEDEDNWVCQWYKRHGFEITGAHDGDIFMEMNLKEYFNGR